MNNNSELGSHPTDGEVNKWDILPKDNFYQFQQNSQEALKNELSDEEIKQKIIAEKRIEKLKEKAEAHEKAKRVAAKFLAVAIGVTALVEISIATGPKSGFLKSEQARQKVIEMENAKEIVFHGNIRSNPETTNSKDSNVYTSIDDEVSIEIPDDSTVYYYRDENDPNGGGYGVPTDLLENESLISKGEARRDDDKTVWINDGNARIISE